MIAVERLTRRYGDRTAVEDVSFEVRAGEVVGFLGPNGAGKTTTLRMLTGFLAPTAGRVRIDGVDVAREPEAARARFGYMPEGVPMYPELRTREYLDFRARLKGVKGSAVGREVDRCLELAGVPEARDRLIGQLSKGTRQRVGLAEALLADPPLLVLDEPTSGLDPNQMRHVRELLRGFSGKKTVFLSTHILSEVEASCERVVIVRGGRKVAEGRPAELRAEASRGAHIVVVGKGSAEPYRLAIAAAAGIADVVVENDDAARLVARVEPGADPTETLDRVHASLVEARLPLREFRPIEGTLEDLFAELTAAAGESP